MGCLGGQTTSRTIEDMSQEERSLMDMITGAVLPAYMKEAGYETTPIEHTSFFNTPEGIRLEKRKSDLQDELDALKKKMDKANLVDYNEMLARHNELERQIPRIEKQIQDGEDGFVPYTEHKTRKLGSAEMESARDAYITDTGSADGFEDSEEYKEIHGRETERKIETEAQKTKAEDQFLKNLNKYLSGDFSVTKSQEKFIQNQMAPIKSAVNAMYDEAEGELSDRYKKFNDQITQTSLEVGDALRVVGETIEETGKNMEEALSSVVSTNRELMKMGIEDKAGEITKNVSMSAIRTGRDPDDAEYQQEIQESIAREIKYGSLNLADMEARGMLSITERTGAGKEGVARALARLEEAEGARREASIMSEGQERQSLIHGRGSGNVRLAEAGSNLRQQIGMGLPPQQIAIGQGFQGFESALSSQRMANMGAPMSAIGFPYNMMSRERFAQPTSVQEKDTGVQDILGIGLGAISAMFGAG